MGWGKSLTTTTLFATFIKSIKNLRKSPRPSFLIKRAALGNLKASFHCTHWHRFFPLKRAPPLTPTLSPSGKREETAPPRRSEPLRSKVGGPKRSSPYFAGWDRLGIAVYSLQLIVIVYDWFRGYLLITCRFLVIFLVVSKKKRNFGGRSVKYWRNWLWEVWIKCRRRISLSLRR